MVLDTGPWNFAYSNKKVLAALRALNARFTAQEVNVAFTGACPYD